MNTLPMAVNQIKIFFMMFFFHVRKYFTFYVLSNICTYYHHHHHHVIYLIFLLILEHPMSYLFLKEITSTYHGNVNSVEDDNRASSTRASQ